MIEVDMPAATAICKNQVWNLYVDIASANADIDLLDNPMIVPAPSSGKFACSNHIVGKSPRVHPAKQRKVFSRARFQVC